MQEFRQLAEDMVTGEHRESEVQPPNLVAEQWSFTLPVVLDSAPVGSRFGSVRHDPTQESYSPGETVDVEFW